MSDREDFQTVRDAGLKARHETRLARAQPESRNWCVVAYRYEGGMEIHGPYSPRGMAATATAVLAGRVEYEATYIIEMISGDR